MLWDFYFRPKFICSLTWLSSQHGSGFVCSPLECSAWCYRWCTIAWSSCSCFYAFLCLFPFYKYVHGMLFVPIHHHTPMNYVCGRNESLQPPPAQPCWLIWYQGALSVIFPDDILNAVLHNDVIGKTKQHLNRESEWLCDENVIILFTFILFINEVIIALPCHCQRINQQHIIYYSPLEKCECKEIKWRIATVYHIQILLLLSFRWHAIHVYMQSEEDLVLSRLFFHFMYVFHLRVKNFSFFIVFFISRL